MNLVQINERLKDLPMQVIQQYANGMNPEVPPYLALGELQRREIAQKQMANTQGAAQGPQPSIKEQVEQKAGLMQLQQMQQQQMQQMQQPRGPMPVPAGVPQPQMQPEMAMARGGLAGIPVRRDMFEYASGGIIAFAEGGQPNGRGQAKGFDGTTGSAVVNPAAAIRPKFETRFDAMTRRNRGELTPEEREEADAKKPRMINLPKGTSRQDAEMVQMQNPDAQVVVEGQGDVLKDLISRFQAGQEGVKKGLADAFTYSSDIEAAKKRREPPVSAPAPQASPVRRMSPPEVAKMLQDPYATGAPAAPEKLSVERDPATKMPMVEAAPAAMPGAVPQAPMQTSAPAFTPSSVSADRAGLEALMKSQQRQAPTAAGIIADVNALKPAGMQDEAQAKLLADQRGRAEARQASYEKSKPSGLDDLIRVFGQAGQFKGLSGLAPAYTANQQQRRSEDLAMEKQQDELLTAIEGRGAAFDKDTFTARTGAMSKAQELFGQSEKSIIDAAAKLYVADQGRLDADNKAKMDRDLREFEAAQRRSLEMMTIAQRERESKRTDARSPAARATEYVNLKAQARALAAKGETAAAAELDAQADDMKSFSGGSGAGDVGAANAQTRMLRDAVKDIDSRLEYLDPKTPEAKNLQLERDRLSKLIVQRAIGEAGADSSAPDGEVDKENPLLKKK